MRHSLIGAAVVVLALSGCGGAGSESAASSASVNFSGTYVGTESGTVNGAGFSQSTTLVLTQNGSTVTGTFDDGGGNTGTVLGTVSGNELNPFAATNSAGNPCGSGTFSGTATLNGTTLTATVSGTASTCGTTIASISATKQ